MGMGRMIGATAVVIITIIVFIATYSIVSWPLEYIVDALIDAPPAGMPAGTGDYAPLLRTLPVFLAAAVIIGIFLIIVWYYVYGHKKEYEVE